MFATASTATLGHFPHHHSYHPHYFHQQQPQQQPQQQTLQQQQPRQQSSLLFTPPSTPSTIKRLNDSDTSQLADFAAMMVYLMWHTRKMIRSADTPHSSASSSPVYGNTSWMWQKTKKPSSTTSPHSHVHPGPFLHPSAYYYYNNASPAFKKFCYQVLTSTQLKESAVYLSLKYIAILLKSNPSIEGAEGSEYRLFIVALMLANKFLDDNTFTNKTWSDVSGMKVHDLNVMEAEFLEALDFNLFVRDYDYRIWKHLLEECRHRAQLYQYYQQHSSSQRQQQLILDILQILGLMDVSSQNSKTSPYDLWVDHSLFSYEQQQQQQRATSSSSSEDPYPQPIQSFNDNASPSRATPATNSDRLFNDEFWDDDTAFRLQLENSRKRYLQFFSQSKATANHQSTLLPPPALYHLMQHQQQQHCSHYNNSNNSNRSEKTANQLPPCGLYSNHDSYLGRQRGYYNFFYGSQSTAAAAAAAAAATSKDTFTNLSQSSWDPLAYTLNRCHPQQQEENLSFYSNKAFTATTATTGATSARPMSWANY
ncbi:cyclin-domain-containing protein [Mycotypha africana]|uniref:cyclin-domain-containing protein n=1 Tax=Mycotypha africana TaxID=64632 RepID=UPI0023009F30|nr:cyclin-domain-containing protein [Mycotypha africana]KAI8970321.1 cyclin-domain-containing protein [Mycotypha africana]